MGDDPLRQRGGAAAAGSPLVQMLMGDPIALGPALQAGITNAVNDLVIDPTAFAPAGAQVSGAFVAALEVGWGNVQWSALLAGAMQADFTANAEKVMRPMVVPIGVQIGDWLSEGAGKSSFAAGIIAAVLEQLAEAVTPPGAPTAPTATVRR